MWTLHQIARKRVISFGRWLFSVGCGMIGRQTCGGSAKWCKMISEAEMQ